MSFWCNRCERSFKWKGSLKRHLGRKRPCRKAMYSCNDCSNVFVSLESLSKHKKLYCKCRAGKQAKKEDSTTSLSSLLDALCNRDHQQIPLDTRIDTSTSINDLLNKLMYGNLTPPRPYGDDLKSEPPVSVALSPVMPPTPAAVDEAHNPFDAAFANALPAPFDQPVEVSAGSSHQFDDILVQWVYEILRIEGKFRHHLLVKDETFSIIDRMVQDGLISAYEHGNLIYINRLFMRLHDLIHMSITALNRREIIDIMLELFQVGKLTKTAFIELCVNNI